MIKLVLDSTGYLPEEVLTKYDVTLVPLSVFVQNREYREGLPGSFEPIYADAEENKVIPTTSLPSTQGFVDAYNKIISDGNEVICLTLASTLSGTNNNARLAAEMCSAPEKVSVLDSGSAAQTIWLYFEEIVERIEAGKTRQEIVEEFPSIRDRGGVAFVPETLENLRRGGRISMLSAALGNVLKIKPILMFQSGVLKCVKKAIGDLKAVLALVESIPKEAKKIIVLRISQSQFFENVKKAVKQHFPSAIMFEGDVGPVIGAHIGRAFGACWIC